MKVWNVCVVTGSRADYGLLRSFLREVQQVKPFNLRLLVTGSHLNRRLGLSCRDIEQDGFAIWKKMPILQYGSDEAGISKSFSRACATAAALFHKERPDVFVVLGDRYEVLAVTVAAYIARIPLVHIHGGEVTSGAIDEGFRHAITKMSQLHFVTTEKHRQRVIQLGEPADQVFVVGAPALDALTCETFLTRDQLAQEVGMDLSGLVALVTYHPETLCVKPPEDQAAQLLKALASFQGKIILTAANADPSGEKINLLLKAFCKQNSSRCVFIPHLGQQRYMSGLRCLDLLVGNSSSGIIEASSFGIPVVNIGERQAGRVRGGNVIDVPCRSAAIIDGIRKALSPEFRQASKKAANPYDPYRDGQAGKRMARILRQSMVKGITVSKTFVDMSSV